MKVALAVLGGALLAGGCGPGLAVRAARPTPADRASGPVMDDVLGSRMLALSALLAGQGFHKRGLFVRGFLPPGARQTEAVSVPAGKCGMFVALATPTMSDLDAALYRPDGGVLVNDEGADARPTLTLCAGDEPVTAYYALHAYQGAGAFVVAQFVRTRVADDDLITEPPLNGATALAELAKALHKRGFDDDTPRVELQLDAAPARVPVRVTVGDCYTLAAEGAEGVSALGLRLLDGSGRELANGVGDPGLAALQYCADQTADLALELTALRGAGIARVARFHAPQVAIGGAHALWLGEPSPSPGAWGPEGPGDGPTPKAKGVVVERHKLSQGNVVELESKRVLAACETWQAVLGPGLSQARLRIESRSGQLLGEADSVDLRARVELCDRKGPLRITLIGRAGFGTVTLTGSAREASRDPAGGPVPEAH